MKNSSSKGLIDKVKAIIKSPDVKKALKELLKSTKNLKDTFDINQ